MLRLKADLHTHTADDPRDCIRYSAEMLIDAVAQLNFDVLAVACHERVVYSRRLAEYAAGRGVLLIPGIELLVEGKHIVVLNPDEPQAKASTYAELRRLGRRNGLIVAPHPFYPEKSCLHKKLVENIDLFDAVEYCCAHFPGVNPNRRAVKVAQRYGLPLVGTSDTHALPYCDSTYSWLEVEEASIEGVLEAVRAGRITVVTRPRPLIEIAKMATFYVRYEAKSLAGWFQ
jgi:predicted metal-dependent phosphoesterase TrpH